MGDVFNKVYEKEDIFADDYLTEGHLQNFRSLCLRFLKIHSTSKNVMNWLDSFHYFHNLRLTNCFLLPAKSV